MQKRQILDRPAGVVLAAVFANFLWGSASPCIKLGYRLFQIPADAVSSQILFAGLRFTLAGFLAVLFGSLVQRRPLRLGKGSGGMLLLLAFTQTVVQYLFFYMGLSKAPGFKGSVISPSSVFFAVLLSALLFRQEKLTWKKLLGCLIGFAGVVVINLNKAGSDTPFRLDGEGFLLLSSFSYACATVLLKRFSERENPVALSAWQFVLGGAVMIVIGLLGGGRVQPTRGSAWLLLLYMAFISSAAYTIWSLLLQRYPVSKITVYSFCNPLFGVFLSAWILGEAKELNPLQCLLALLLVCAGILIVNRNPGTAKTDV